MANNKVVPESQPALDQLKYEIAAEMGLPVGNYSYDNTEFAAELGSPNNGLQREKYWGNISSRDTGAVGGAITARLIQLAEKTLFEQTDY